MKKILSILLAVTALVCFAACEDGKCDTCGREADDVKVYEELDNKELCLACALEEGFSGIIKN